MPIYEYRCEACGHELEALQKMSDEALVLCPQCNEPSLKKLVSASGFRLKGGGWYETDFKGKGKGQKNLHGEKEKKKESDKKPDAAKKKDTGSASSGAGGSPS